MKKFLLFLFFTNCLFAMKELDDNVENTKGPYLHPSHIHSLYLCNIDNGWRCDGHDVGGCLGGFNGEYYKTYGQKRYRCKICDFDLCKKCLDARDGDIETDKHEHKLCKSYIDNGWKCDNKKCLSNIKNFYQSGGIARYHCWQCDFDLCENCLKGKVVQVIYSPIFSERLDRDEVTDKCLKCGVNERNAMIIHGDIGHICCCMKCAEEMKECYLCHQTIDMVVNYFIN